MRPRERSAETGWAEVHQVKHQIRMLPAFVIWAAHAATSAPHLRDTRIVQYHPQPCAHGLGDVGACRDARGAAALQQAGGALASVRTLGGV